MRYASSLKMVSFNVPAYASSLRETPQKLGTYASSLKLVNIKL